MRRIRHDIANHRASAILFLAFWLAAYALHVFGWRRPDLPPGRDDMAGEVIIIHLFLPVIAGALVAWWRGRSQAVRGALLAGAAVLLVDAIILVAPVAVRDPYGEGSPYIAVPMAIIIFSCAGAALGFIGALITAVLRFTLTGVARARH